MRLIDADALTKEKNIYEADLQLMVPLHIIQDAPAIEAEPVRHGRWESFDDNSWRCSECRRENCYAYDEISQRFTDFYCPNCGAKMDKEG